MFFDLVLAISYFSSSSIMSLIISGLRAIFYGLSIFRVDLLILTVNYSLPLTGYSFWEDLTKDLRGRLSLEAVSILIGI